MTQRQEAVPGVRMRGSGNSRWRRCIAPGLAALALAALPAAAVQAQSDLDAAELKLLVEGLRNGTVSSAHASAECTRGVAGSPESETIKQLMTGYLEVPEALALAAFCDGLMRAIVTRDIGADTLLAVNREELDATVLHEFGRVLRAVYFAHRRATSASVGASVEAQVPQ